VSVGDSLSSTAVASHLGVLISYCRCFNGSLINIPRRKLSEVNKSWVRSLRSSETELLSTVEACSALLAEGQDLDTGEGATQVTPRCTICATGVTASGK